MKKNKVDDFLKSLRRKIWISNILKMISNGILISSIGCLCTFVVAHVYPIVYVLNKNIMYIEGVMILSLVIGFFKRPSIEKTAFIGDGLGLNERLTTYLEYKNKEGLIVEIFKEEVEEVIESFDFLKKYKFDFSFKKILVSILIFVLSTAIYFIPSRTMEVATEKEEINKELRKEAENIEKIQKHIENHLEENENNRKEEKEKLLFHLNHTAKKLEKTFDYDEGAAQVVEAQKRLKEMGTERMGEDLKNIAGVFDGLSNKSGLKDTFASGNVENVIKELKNQTFTLKEKDRAIKNIKEMEKSLNEGDSKKDLLKKMKTSLKEKSTGEKIAQSISDKKKNKIMKELTKEAETKLSSMKERLISKGDKGFKSNGGEDQVSDFAKGENEGLDGGEMSAQKSDEMALGISANQKMDRANGVGGSGHIDTQSEDGTLKKGQVSKKDESTRLGEGETYESFIKGNWQETGRIQNKDSDDVISIDGEMKSLDYMYTTFKKEGLNYVLKQEIPIEHKQLVLEYFRKLNGGQKNGREDH